MPRRSRTLAPLAEQHERHPQLALLSRGRARRRRRSGSPSIRSTPGRSRQRRSGMKSGNGFGGTPGGKREGERRWGSTCARTSPRSTGCVCDAPAVRLRVVREPAADVRDADARRLDPDLVHPLVKRAVVAGGRGGRRRDDDPRPSDGCRAKRRTPSDGTTARGDGGAISETPRRAGGRRAPGVVRAKRGGARTTSRATMREDARARGRDEDEGGRYYSYPRKPTRDDSASER